MRLLPSALAVSALLHVGAIAWVHAHEAPRKSAIAAISVAPPRRVEPMSVTLLDDAPPPAPKSTRSAMPLAGARAIVATHAPHAAETAHTPAAPVEPPHDSPLMHMRQPELPRALSDEAAAAFLAKPPPKPAALDATDEPEYRTPRERTIAAIAVARGKLNNRDWVDHAIPDELRDARIGLEALKAERDADPEELAPNGDGSYSSTHETFSAHINPDGTVALHDAPDVDIKPSCLFAGCKMGLDDWFMRRHGIDPYAANKLRWLDKTRDERARIGMAYRKELLGRSMQLMKQNLDRAWAHAPTADARKQVVFDLWDEVAERGDTDLVAGAADARAYLVGFVRTHLPAGSRDAFTVEELARLNARRTSSERFAPYE